MQHVMELTRELSLYHGDVRYFGLLRGYQVSSLGSLVLVHTVSCEES